MRHRSLFLASILFSRVHGCISMLLLLSWIVGWLSLWARPRGKQHECCAFHFSFPLRRSDLVLQLLLCLIFTPNIHFTQLAGWKNCFFPFIFCNSKSAVICWLTWICEESYNIVLFWLWVKLALKVPITQCWWKGVCLAVLCKVAWWPFCQVHWI